MRDPPDRDVAIFTEALQLPASEHAACLDRACGNDGELRRKVEALLESHSQIGNFLENSPRGISLPARPGTAAGEKPGDRIGHFKLLQQIGEGGCGIVFMAEQEEPVRRRVALKVIKPGMDTKSIIARFEAERQALALMDHPNIAKIFDAGATESGRPYFVMELVRGVKITEYCDQHSLTTGERLELFIQVCKAVQHAHQKGIIHRDIKPSNILVTTTTEGKALPVVIDFGIAKATTNQRLTDKTLFTAFEMLIGTPAYMSPEQAELTSLDVDTRTDIYSLGVLLYELLTGSTPFDTGELLKAGLDEIRRVIREEEPARPSTRLSKMSGADLTAVAHHRKSVPPTLIHTVRGDLDWIAMKALEKDRTRRYETADGLALDLQRHLGHEPVAARPAGTIYRVRKFIRRNQLVFAAAMAIAAMLVLGIAASLWQASRANLEASRALAAEQRATAQAAAERAAREQAESIAKFMTEVFQSPDPSRDGRTITVAETLDRAAARLENDLANQPDRQARLQETLAFTYNALGLPRQAVPLRKRVRDYYRGTLGLEHHQTLVEMGYLAVSYSDAGRKDEALKLREEVLALRRKVNGPENTETLVAMGELSLSYFDAGRRDEAIKLQEEVLKLSRKVNGGIEAPVTLPVMNNLALSYFHTGRNDEALKMQEEVLKLSRKVNGGTENPATLTTMNNLALSYAAAGRKDEATKLQEEVLALRRKVNGPESAATMIAMNNLANSYLDSGRKEEALKVFEDLLALQRKVLDPELSDPMCRAVMFHLANSYFGAGRKDEALRLREELLALERKALDPEHPDPIFLPVMYYLADSYSTAGRKQEANKLRGEACRFSLKQDSSSPASAVAYAGLGFTLDAEGRSEEAIKAWQEAVRINPGGTQNAAYWLGKALVDRQRYAEAVPILRATRKFYPDGARGRETAERLALAEAMVAGQDAKPDASDRSLAALRQTLDDNPSDTDKAKQLATIYLWLGRTNEHQAVCRKLLDLAANSSDPATHDRAAKAYLVQAHPDPEMLKQAVASGRRALQLAAANDPNRPWFLVTAGMAAVRDAKLAEAESLLDQALNVPGNDPARRSLALAYRTLARAHLGRTEDARTDLAELEKLVPAFPPLLAPSATLLQPDFLAVCLAREEAKSPLSQVPSRSKP